MPIEFLDHPEWNIAILKGHKLDIICTAAQQAHYESEI